MSSSADILGPNGPFTQLLPGFAPRDGQRQMAQAVERTLAKGEVLIAESGTGTGKTFAYLVPALLSGQRVLISTGTRHLQDQLFHRDLPTVRRALGLDAGAAILKGRANYLCRHRLDIAASRREGWDAREFHYLERIRAWSLGTAKGEIGELPDIPEDAGVWQAVTSTADNCVGTGCDHYRECFVYRARKAAVEADVVVVNHHLFCADLALKEDGFGQLLPGVDAVIFDEAHQLPEVASTFLGQSVSTNQLRELCRDAMEEEEREQSQVPELTASAHALEHTASQARALLGAAEQRLDWERACALTGFHDTLAALETGLAELVAALHRAAPAGEGLTRCWQRAEDLRQRFIRVRGPADPDYVRWLETAPRSFRIHETPLHVGPTLRDHLDIPGKSWVFTSATLAVGGDFAHFVSQIGIETANTACWDSPFDFQRQALLYLPADMPDPRAPGFATAVATAALPVLRASRGRAFLLFTSHRALQEALRALDPGAEFNLLVQGSAPRNELLERFRRTERAVLLGTASFWEGVDVRGEALSCVIIDKLPFDPPDDPVLRARLRAIEVRGGNSFMEYQLPNAVLALKQGAGRLIRDHGDHGVLMLCDPRVLSKGYGRVFLNSLPSMPVTRVLADVQAFFSEIDEALASGGGE